MDLAIIMSVDIYNFQIFDSYLLLLTTSIQFLPTWLEHGFIPMIAKKTLALFHVHFTSISNTSI